MIIINNGLEGRNGFFLCQSPLIPSIRGYHLQSDVRMSVVKVYEEIIDFIAAGTSPFSVIQFHPSSSVKDRVADLIVREKTEGLTHDEKSELDVYMQLEHIMRLAKARARNYIMHG